MAFNISQDHSCQSIYVLKCFFIVLLLHSTLLQGSRVVVSARSFADFTPQASFDIKVKLAYLLKACPKKLFSINMVQIVEVWPSSLGQRAFGADGAHQRGWTQILPYYADHETHGAEGRSALQAKDHTRLLSPVWWPGNTKLNAL